MIFYVLSNKKLYTNINYSFRGPYDFNKEYHYLNDIFSYTIMISVNSTLILTSILVSGAIIILINRTDFHFNYSF